MLMILCAGCHPVPKDKADNNPRRIEILFLGHAQEHHNARAYMPILSSALTKNGINITYTEKLEDLNPTNLDLYDGLIVYANHEYIGKDQEKALLHFVASGKAFIPIHSASFCFKNSPAYIDLVGAQFKEHKTGTFTATIIKKDHPALRDVEEFSTWDETYVHDKISKDITVLMERVEGEHHEPWTWVKEYGKGKVFYTAYGHDERTWTNAGFQNLITQGILWAVGPTVKKNWEAFVADIPILVYEEKSNIPNYEQRDPAPKYQLPLTPEASQKLMQVPAGFELELFAAEPDIIKPIAMNWDEKGRLWVIETVDYPNTVLEDKGLGDDRIKICEDTDGDGKADKFTVFADKLNIPTSFAFANGGIIVSQAPHFIFLKDTDGDDKADVKEVLIDGWGVYDTHAGPSNLQNGMDNKIYGVVGYSGFKGSIFGQAQEFAQGIYNFDPKLNNFEFLTNTSNNTWGLGITEDNSIFASTANNTHSVFMGIPNKYFKDVLGITPQGSAKIDGHYFMQPITPNVRQVDVFGGFTAAAGHHFYTAHDYPKSFWNQVAFVCEPTGGLVHMANIARDGAGYVEYDGGNLLASSDEWVSPVEAKVGPDGAVWVLDWYNFIVQHNPTPRLDRGGYDAVNGKGNAYENPLRDTSKGRIWRVVPKHKKAPTLLALNIDKPKELVHALSNDNMFWRMTAQRLLVDRGETDIVNDLYKLINNLEVDGQGMNPRALHALWTLDGLGAIDTVQEAVNVVTGALYHPAASVRKAAIQILPKSEITDHALLKTNVLFDPDPKVQLAAILYFSERPASEVVGAQLFTLGKSPKIMADSWLSKATYIAASKHRAGFIASYLKSNPRLETGSSATYNKYDVEYNDKDWKTMQLPQSIEQGGLDMDGTLWFRKTFSLPENIGLTGGNLSLGPINDSDIVYINGKQVGATKNEYLKPRRYMVPKGVLEPGLNVIAIWVEDTGGSGGLEGTKEQLNLTIGSRRMPLSGDWRYEVEKDYSGRSNIFSGTSIAEVLYKNYKGQPLTATSPGLAGVNATVINIKTIKNEMKYDVTEFTVKAGSVVEIIFENPDFMQHNLLILAQGSKNKVGAASDQLAQDPAGADKSYIPEMQEVLFATAMVDPQQQVVLQFTAPSKPGNYPYICTFPGHWRIMQGVMKVVASK